jgi:hypothetical protein
VNPATVADTLLVAVNNATKATRILAKTVAETRLLYSALTFSSVTSFYTPLRRP